MEPSAEEQVLVNIPETLDAIFRFLDPKNLVKCRTVCRHWRAISNVHMKRRLTTKVFDKLSACFGTMETDGFHELHKVKLIGFEESLKDKTLSPSTMANEKGGFTFRVMLHCRKQEGTELQCLVIQDASSPAVVVVEGKAHQVGWRKVKPMPWFVSTVLQVDWLPSVEKLVLDRCLTVDDWNAAANAILAKFPALVELQLWLPQDRSSVLPLAYAELLAKESRRVEFPSLKKVVVHYYIWFGPDKPIGYEPNIADLKLESVEWSNGVNWGFLMQCPTLQILAAWICFGTLDEKGALHNASIDASRSVLENTVHVEYSPWKLIVFNGNDSSVIDSYEIDSANNGYDSVLAQDIANLINTLRPAQLGIPLQLKLHSALSSSTDTKSITQLVFSEMCLQGLPFYEFTASPHDVASAFKLAASFDNIQRLDFPYICKCYPLNLEGVPPLDPARSANNLVTLMLKSSNDWMQEHLSKLMPNVQLLVFSYPLNLLSCSEVPKVMKLCSSFPKLKHLVIRALELDIKAFGDEFAIHIIKCLNEFQSLTLTVIADLYNEEDLVLLTKQCLDICAPTESIRKLNVFADGFFYMGETEELDISKLGLSIPDHLAVRAGTASLLGHGEVEFDGMDHSYITRMEMF